MGWVKFASDYEADQRQMQATADGLQSIVLSSSNVGPDIAAPWAEFYKALSALDATPVYDIWRPWLPTPHFLATSGLADTFASYASQLDGWRTKINSAAGSDVPGGVDPTGQGNQQQMASVVKYGALGAASLVLLYVAKTAVDIVRGK